MKEQRMNLKKLNTISKFEILPPLEPEPEPQPKEVESEAKGKLYENKGI